MWRRGHARLVNINVARHSDGRWYATICYGGELRVPADQHSTPAGPVVGVDRGVKTAAVVATSGRQLVNELPAVRALRDALRHVKHLQRAVSRAEKGSANRHKAVTRLGQCLPGSRPYARTRCTRSPPGSPATTPWLSWRD
ncbi:hypothetical protein [Micromonospora sp. NPDC049679]|uniref:hypothetical protein n=1 Tax=Micromonospora sp. NPDC049679 TaxID=3155920 RepID=UPI003409144C